ncbi:MAG: NusA-like transcription termination signal-binding factor [Candidatus Pacearchaeota archaeon]
MKVKLDLRSIQYMNLFEKLTHVKAKYCFDYDSTIIFIVPKFLMSRALGERAKNIEKLEFNLHRKVRIIANPVGINDIERFIKAIIFPHEFKKIVIENNEVYIFSAPRTKAAIIGRNKVRLEGLTDILDKFFGIKKVIIK